MTRIKLRHVHRYTKGGRVYHYFRRGDVNVRLPGLPGSKEFMDAYAAALEQKAPPIGAAKVVPRSMAALAASWYDDPTFTAKKQATQHNYRRILEAFLKEHGHRLVADVEPHHLLRIINRKKATPAAANGLRKVLRLLFKHAFADGWRKDNPTRDIAKVQYEERPFATWGEDDIAAFEARWAVGSRARLALALLLYTGQRRSDVIRMGPQHVRNGFITVKQRKTGTPLELRMHPDLLAELAAAPREHLAFLMTELGKPFASGNAFYNWFMDCAAKAGLPRALGPHGLRKAAVCRLLEAGATIHEVMAVTGHRSVSEVQKYAAQVNQRKLATAGIEKLPIRQRD